MASNGRETENALRASADPPGSVAALRAEVAAHGADATALLLHELAVAEENAGDAHAAARDYLAAFQADGAFREPLESLLALLERRGSTKNLGKLLDGLVLAAKTPEERARAQLDLAAFLLAHPHEDGDARGAIEAAIEARPDDPRAWLELEVLAAKLGDLATRERALAARAALAIEPTYRALLHLGVADLARRAGANERAHRSLADAAAPETVARWRALRAKEALARETLDAAALSSALAEMAALVDAAMADASLGERLGVPPHAKRAEHAAALRLLASAASRRAGEAGASVALVEAAKASAPADPLVTMAARGALANAGERAAAASAAASLLERGADGAFGAALGLQIAEHAHAEGDVRAAIDTLEAALTIDPTSLAARALLLESLADGHEPARLSRVFEALAKVVEAPASRVRYALSAATAWALFARDADAARGALAAARDAGEPALAVARAARALAAATHDRPWWRSATRELASLVDDEHEATSLALDLVRAALASGDDDAARDAADELARVEGGELVGRILGAYAPAFGAPPDATALDALAATEPDPALARAFALAAARRADLAGATQDVVARLSRLVAADRSDLVAGLWLVDLLRREGEPGRAADALVGLAAATTDAELAAALRIEAATLRWRAGARGAAIAGVAPLGRAAEALVAWSRRADDPADFEARRALFASHEREADGRVGAALEQFALEAVHERGDPLRARGALEVMDAEGAGELVLAGALGRVLVGEAAEDGPRLARALDRISGASPEAAKLAALERVRISRDREARVATADAARARAEAEPTLVTTLEWLGAARAARTPGAELVARDRLAAIADASIADAATSAAALARVAMGLPLDAAGGAYVAAGTSPAARLLALELSPPASPPLARAATLEAASGALGTDEARLDALLLSGFAKLAAGADAEALASFQAVVEDRPDDFAAWEGARAAALALGDGAAEAEASARLSTMSGDDDWAASLAENAALAWLDDPRRESDAEAALERAFRRDPTRRVAFDRLFRRVRDQGDGERLLDLVERRLAVTDDPTEIAKLYWERARALRQKGDRDGALAALEHVALLEPDHVGALALTGEILIGRERFDDAAAKLSRLASLPSAPTQQRLVSGIAAVDLYENKLGDPERALGVLVELHKAGLSTLPVRERLARAAARTESWAHAAAILDELMRERPTASGRVEAARLAMVIWRDRLGDPSGAARAAERLLVDEPADPEAIDLLLAHDTSSEGARAALSRARGAVLLTVERAPLDAASWGLAARLARATGDLALRQASLGALVALGKGDKAALAELAELDVRAGALPPRRFDDGVLALLRDDGERGPLTRLFATLAGPLAEAIGPSLSALGLGRRERVDKKSGHAVRAEVVAWADALGLDELEVYVGGADPRGIRGIPAEVPAIVVGAGVRSPLAPAERQSLARELFALRAGTTAVRARDDATLVAIVAAACNLAEVTHAFASEALVHDVQRSLGKAISRKTKKALPEICREIVATSADVGAWAAAARRSMYRVAIVSTGDASFALADKLGGQPTTISARVVADEEAQRLLAFVASRAYHEARARLGWEVK